MHSLRSEKVQREVDLELGVFGDGRSTERRRSAMNLEEEGLGHLIWIDDCKQSSEQQACENLL